MRGSTIASNSVPAHGSRGERREDSELDRLAVAHLDVGVERAALGGEIDQAAVVPLEAAQPLDAHGALGLDVDDRAGGELEAREPVESGDDDVAGGDQRVALERQVRSA